MLANEGPVTLTAPAGTLDRPCGAGFVTHIESEVIPPDAARLHMGMM